MCALCVFLLTGEVGWGSVLLTETQWLGGHKMSYDVQIGNFDGNYTSNGSEIFYEHIPSYDDSVAGLWVLHGMTGKQGVEVLSSFFNNVQNERRNIGSDGMRDKYDAENGWGSTEGLLIFAAQIMAACAANKKKIISVYG